MQWAGQAGLDLSSDSFNDLYSLDPEVDNRFPKPDLQCSNTLNVQMLALIPRPVKAVILVFPYSEARHGRDAEDERLAKEGGPKIDESVFWMKQTVRLMLFSMMALLTEIQIRNACGAMAMIHSIANVSPDMPAQVKSVHENN
jgi:ubiquitin carboxyl-terminal hydrolase L3